MRERGELGSDRVIPTAFGELTLAQGDRVYFRRNDKSLGVKNGSLGTVTSIDMAAGESGKLGVRLDAGRDVEFLLSDYNSVSRGLAATVHRSQGVTVDQAHYLVTPLVDMNLSYVAMTRHRDEAHLYYATEQIRDRRTLVDVLGREGDKDTSLDYELRSARELAMRELQLRAQEEVVHERDHGALLPPDRDLRELIALAHAGARDGDRIRPTLQVRLADALGATLDGDRDAAQGLLIAETARGSKATTFGQLINELRIEQRVAAGSDRLATDLAGNLELVVQRRGEDLAPLLALEAPALVRQQAAADDAHSRNVDAAIARSLRAGDVDDFPWVLRDELVMQGVRVPNDRAVDDAVIQAVLQASDAGLLGVAQDRSQWTTQATHRVRAALEAHDVRLDIREDIPALRMGSEELVTASGITGDLATSVLQQLDTAAPNVQPVRDLGAQLDAYRTAVWSSGDGATSEVAIPIDQAMQELAQERAGWALELSRSRPQGEYFGSIQAQIAELDVVAERLDILRAGGIAELRHRAFGSDNPAGRTEAIDEASSFAHLRMQLRTDRELVQGVAENAPASHRQAPTTTQRADAIDELIRRVERAELDRRYGRGEAIPSPDQAHGAGEDGIPVEGRKIEVRVADSAAITARAAQLIESDRPLDIAAGLLALTGRRPIEILKTARFELTGDQNTVMFSGQAKSIELRPIEIPTLIDAKRITAALERLRDGLPLQHADNTAVNRQTAKQLGQIVRRHFSEDLVPKDLRDVYLDAAYNARKPEVSRWAYAAEILGHDPLDVSTGFGYQKIVSDPEQGLAQIEAGRRETLDRLNAAAESESDSQMQSFLRDRSVQLRAASWTVAERGVEVKREPINHEQRRDVVMLDGKLDGIAPANAKGKAYDAILAWMVGDEPGFPTWRAAFTDLASCLDGLRGRSKDDMLYPTWREAAEDLLSPIREILDSGKGIPPLRESLAFELRALLNGQHTHNMSVGTPDGQSQGVQVSAGEKNGAQMLDSVRNGDLKVGDPVSVTADRAQGADGPELRLADQVRGDHSRSTQRRLEPVEHMVVGWYRAAHDERLPMMGHAVMNVPAGEYPIVAERRGDRIDRLGVDLLGKVVTVGDRADLNVGTDRAARRPLTEEQFVGLAGKEGSAFRLEPAIASIADGRLAIAKETPTVRRIPRARGTYGVTYSGPIIRASGHDVVQQLAGGELVRHDRRAMEQRVLVGHQVKIAYDERSKGQVQRIARTRGHGLAHGASSEA
jgi:hypothetical protein